jgi:hypothetical protein
VNTTVDSGSGGRQPESQPPALESLIEATPLPPANPVRHATAQLDQTRMPSHQTDLPAPAAARLSRSAKDENVEKLSTDAVCHDLLSRFNGNLGRAILHLIDSF